MDFDKVSLKGLKEQADVYCKTNNFNKGTRYRASVYGFVKWIEELQADSKTMYELDEEIKKNPKLAKQMDNSFMYPNEE